MQTEKLIEDLSIIIEVINIEVMKIQAYDDLNTANFENGKTRQRISDLADRLLDITEELANADT